MDERPAAHLDPGSGRFADAAEAGLLLREILDDLRLRSYPKTSGSRGLHVLVPLRPGPGQDEVRDFAMHVGRLMATRAPRLVTLAWDEVDPKLDPARFNLTSIERRLAAGNPRRAG